MPRARKPSSLATILSLSLGAPLAGAQPASAPPPAPSAPSTPGTPAGAAATEATPRGFSFGSYGRVTVASDLRGRSGQQANLVAHGPRLDLPPYAELQFNYDAVFGRIRARTVITLAVNENLFHFNGRFDGTFAVRNLYLEAQGVFSPQLSLWVGSRMYRGDDIYLLNWWPLDNLNTVGGGARYELGGRLILQAQLGMNRLDDPYQLQSIRIAPREGFGPQNALLLDRPRLLASAKATYFFQPLTSRGGLKLSLYGELHSMAAGVRQTNDAGARELLPADGGTVLGAQLGGWTGERSTFFNVWVRYARGLGAYGDLRVPVSQGTARSASRAEEFLVAAAGNWERGAFGVLFGAYARYFRDADPSVFSRGALWEGAVALRPTVWFGQHAGLSLEGSYQRIVYNALDPVTGEGAAQGSLFRVGVVPFVTPAGRGNFTRPHLQVIYTATVRDAGARRLYAPDDPFGFNSVEHFLGLGTEWWFNSSYL